MRKEYWSGLPFPSPVDHILSELSTMNHPSLVVLQGMAYGFIELDKTVVHVIDWLVFCDCCFQSVCPLMEKDKRLMEASWWERLTEKETGSYFGAMLSKSLIQFSVDGWGCIPSLLFTWGQTMVVMSMYRVFSCVVGRGCLLWPVCSLGQTLLAFALLYSVFQG